MGDNRMRAPAGYRVQVVVDTYNVCETITVYLWIKKDWERHSKGKFAKPVGFISGQSYGGDFSCLTTHSMIEEKHRGKGLGAFLYDYLIDYALSNRMKIESSAVPSHAAEMVWKGSRLNQKYVIEERKRNRWRARYRVIRRKGSR